ncbi:MAG: P1 family peptidase [Clostridium sp.]
MRKRIRDLGITIGNLETGEFNSITDVEGVVVGHKTLKGENTASGITVIVPNNGNLNGSHCEAGAYRFNGTGELTGYHWICETGTLISPIIFTGSHLLGLAQYNLSLATRRLKNLEPFSVGVVGETWDGWLSNIYETYIDYKQVEDTILLAKGGPVEEGSVGGGTGMISFEFKGGIGSSSRVIQCDSGKYTVGVLVQSNFGRREDLTINGEKIGKAIDSNIVPLPWDAPENDGSLLVCIATDAPLTSKQCERVSKRASLAMARLGSIGEEESGDFFLTFSTSNTYTYGGERISTIKMLPSIELDSIFEGVIDATEEAILNSLTMATTTYGQQGRVAHQIPLEYLTKNQIKDISSLELGEEAISFDRDCSMQRAAVKEQELRAQSVQSSRGIVIESVNQGDILNNSYEDNAKQNHTKTIIKAEESGSEQILKNLFPTIQISEKPSEEILSQPVEAPIEVPIKAKVEVPRVLSIEEQTIETITKLALAYLSNSGRGLSIGIESLSGANWTIEDGIFNLPYENESFKVVALGYRLSSLGINNKVNGIKEILRLLEPGGVIVLGDYMFEDRLGEEITLSGIGQSESLKIQSRGYLYIDWIQDELSKQGRGLSYKKIDQYNYVITIV